MAYYLKLFAIFAANNLKFTTMKRLFFLALLLLAAGVQTVQAQSMIVKTSDGRLVPFGIEEVDSVFFTDANYVGGHEYIDLGLPSGTLWASCNVGADTPEAYGELFAWGETTPPPVKDAYDWDTYSLCEGTRATITRYNDKDYMMWLKPADDAATSNWGSMWQMPSKEQFEELINSDYSLLEFITQNGVVGLKVTSKINGNAIFLPAAGQYAYNGYENASKKGCYWSRTRYAGEAWFAHLLLFQPDYNNLRSTYGYRFCGNSVRAVRYKEVKYVEEITLNETSLDLYPGETFQLSATVSPADAVNTEVRWESSEPNAASVSDDGVVTAKNVSNMSCTITCYALDGSGTKGECQVTVSSYVDLGLPSGTLWSKCNLGADTPEDCGTYFAWGETQTKEEYNWSTYKYCNGSNKKLTKYCYDKSYGNDNYYDGVTELTLYDDAATMSWGGNWRMPSYTQILELVDNTTHKMTTRNNVEGCLMTSKINGKSIFLPAGGWYNKNSSLSHSSNGYYWTSSLSINESNKASHLHFYGNNVAFVNENERCNGMTIRPVRLMDLPMPDVRRIILSEKNLKFDLGEGTKTTLTATILPSNASNAVSWSSSNTYVATVNSNGLVTPVGIGTCTITCTAADGSGVKGECQVTVERLSGTYNGHQWVDLGLESGTLWATCNIGSSTPEGTGVRFAWGEYSTKSEYTYNNYKWKGANGTEQYIKYTIADGDTNGNWYDSNGNFIGDGIKELEFADDAASRNWGNNWRMPTEAQLQELFYEAHYGNHTSKTWTTINGVSGYKITSKITGKSIFLPASEGSAIYWARDLSSTKTVGSLWIKYRLSTYDNFGFYLVPRYSGEYVRPVVKP